MPINYSLPGAEFYQMKPALPGAFTEPVIRGSDQSYIIDHFGKTVSQSVSTQEVIINLRVIEWNSPKEIRCHYELSPGMFTRLVVSGEVMEKICGVPGTKLRQGEFLSLIGSSFTTMVSPEQRGKYISIGFWWSAEFLKDIFAEHPRLQKKMDTIVAGYPKGLPAPPLMLTSDISETVDDLLHFDYQQPGVNKFLHEKMKKLARMVVRETVELNAIRADFRPKSWEKILQIKDKLDDEPMADISIAEMKEEFDISPTTIQNGINALTLQSFEEYRRTNKIIEAARIMLQEKEQIKNISRFAGYKRGEAFSENFKTLFWCLPSLFTIKNNEGKIDTNYTISRTDKLKYGSIVARYMSERETAEDLEALYGWLAQHNNHLQLFGQLLDETKSAWAREWFDDVGIKHNKIKWIKEGGWYRYDLSRAEQVEFYKYAILMAIYFITHYFFEI